MSSQDNDAKWHNWETIMRGWGHDIIVQPGAYGANNGIQDYVNGDPDGWVDHHFVCSLDPSQAQGYADMLTNGYGDAGGSFLPGPVVPTCVDSIGRVWLISTRPANHAGMGNAGVLARILAGQAPLGPAATYAPGNDYVMNDHYAGTECLHPGDSTPYPDAMISSLVDINAAYCIAFNRSPNTILMHLESTDRKDDMSYDGGVSGTGGALMRAKVAARVAENNNPQPAPQPLPPVEDFMTPDDKTFLTEQFQAIHDEVGNVARTVITREDSMRTVENLIAQQNGLIGTALAGLTAAVKKLGGGK